jgi:hypothetical protein
MRALSLLLVALLIFTSVGFADEPVLLAETPPVPGEPQETPQAARIKAQVRKRGTGKNSKVKVTLENGTSIKGYISKIDESSFDLNGDKTASATSISYADVHRIQGPGLSMGAKVGIGVAIGVGVLLVLVWRLAMNVVAHAA